ncbi:hypothetical protein ABZ769_13790 [Streptomyces olivoreticuli]
MLVTAALAVIGGAVGVTAVIGSPDGGRQETETRLPIQNYLLSYSERDAVEQAYEHQVQACMRRQGVEGFSLQHARRHLPDVLDRRYGLTNLREAQQYGYGLTPENVPPPGLPTMTADQRTLYRGDSSGGQAEGCVGLTIRDLGGLPSRPWETPFAVKIQKMSWEASAKHPRMVEAFRRWSACMSGHGYHFATPMDTPGKAKRDKNEERELASTEVRCNRSSGVVRDWFAAEAAYQSTLIARHKDNLDAEHASALRAVMKARDLLNH